jgi:zinc transport system permease protein
MDRVYELFRQMADQGFLPDTFEHGFMVRALIAGMILGPLLGGMGTMIVARKLSFFTQTIGHASLTGVALGLLFGEPLGETYAGLYGFALLAAVLMLYIRNRTGAASDTIIGVVLAQTLGLGILTLVLVTKRFDVHQVEAILFGSLLTLSESDLLLIALIGALAASILVGIFNPFMLMCFNPVLARARNAKPVLIEYLFVLTATLVVVSSLKLIGALLVLALVVVPAAAAGNVAGNLRAYFWSSVLIATFSTLTGLALSSYSSVPTGAAIVLVASGVFYLTWLKKIFADVSPVNQGESQ